MAGQWRYTTGHMNWFFVRWMVQEPCDAGLRVLRFIQYAFFYGTVLLPETLMLVWLTPNPIRFIDVLGFTLAGYSTLLFLNSLLFVRNWKIGDFLKLSAGIFGILYFGVLGGVLIALSGFFFITAFVLLIRGYYRYEVR